MAYDNKYAIELWSSAGLLLADLSGMARNRSYSITRNDAESISFELNLDEFEAYCRTLALSPSAILTPGVTEVRVRRGGTYMIGGQVNLITASLDANQHSISVKANGFLNLFKDRYTAIFQNYTGIQTSQIAANLITTTQTGGNLITNSDFETDLLGWSVSGASITQSNIQAYSGTKSLQASFTATGQYVAYNYNTFDVNLVYQAGVWALIPTGKQVSINITYGGGSGNTSQTYTGTGVWQFIQTNPQSAGLTTGQVQIVSITAGSYLVYIDSAILAATDVLVSPIISGVNPLDFGITIGSLATTSVRSRQYKRDIVKDALQELTNVTTGSIDFEFTYDKIFKTYTSIGTTRPDIVFEYPRNIKSVGFTSDATSMGNQIIGLGSGNGSITQLVYSAQDNASLPTYKQRQRIYNNSAQDNTDNALADGTNIELSKWSNPVRLLDLLIDGNQAPYVTDYKIGDRVSISVTGYSLFTQINGTYRIEKIAVMVDDDDNEEITLTVSA